MTLAGKRLVILGCGYVGSAVAEAAKAAGAQVEALTRNREKASTLRHAGLERVVVADLASHEWHREIEPGADYVLNCVSSGGTANYRHSYVDGMRSMLAWLASKRIWTGTVVYTSSTAVYPQDGGAVVSETCEAAGSTPNGVIIRESEVLLEQIPPKLVRRWFILRLAGIYGPDRHHLLDELRAGSKTLGGSGDHHLNLVHRDDIVRGILDCFLARVGPANRIFNLADDAPARRSEVVDWLCGELGRPAPTFDGSTSARRSGAPMPDRRISNARIQREIGWRPQFRDFRAGFAEIMRPPAESRSEPVVAGTAKRR